jgi:hypothetical protein
MFDSGSSGYHVDGSEVFAIMCARNDPKVSFVVIFISYCARSRKKSWPSVDRDGFPRLPILLTGSDAQ